MSTFTVPPSRKRYVDRRQAGAALAKRLREFAGRSDVIVLGLPRGGVPVGYEVAAVLQVPFDVFVVRKLGLPGHAELAIGAIAPGGVRVLNDDLIRQFHVPLSAIDAVTHAEGRELERRERAYRGARPPLALEGRVVILVDDGLATGSTMRAAVLAVRRALPSQIVVAVPVGSRDACLTLNEVADDVVCALVPEPLTAVGVWYEDFAQTTDDEVRRLLASSGAPRENRRSA